jgi:hypothetical protein
MFWEYQGKSLRTFADGNLLIVSVHAGSAIY